MPRINPKQLFTPQDFDAINYVKERYNQTQNMIVKECADDIIECVKTAKTSSYKHLWIIYHHYDNRHLQYAKKLIDWTKIDIKVEFYPAILEQQTRVRAAQQVYPILIAVICNSHLK